MKQTAQSWSTSTLTEMRKFMTTNWKTPLPTKTTLKRFLKVKGMLAGFVEPSLESTRTTKKCRSWWLVTTLGDSQVRGQDGGTLPSPIAEATRESMLGTSLGWRMAIWGIFGMSTFRLMRCVRDFLILLKKLMLKNFHCRHSTNIADRSSGVHTSTPSHIFMCNWVEI